MQTAARCESVVTQTPATFVLVISCSLLGKCVWAALLAHGPHHATVIQTSITIQTCLQQSIRSWRTSSTERLATNFCQRATPTLEKSARHAPAQEVGDSVADTPWEAQPQYGCPDPPPKSCPNRPAGQPASDPIHNFMDYSVDACMTQVCAAGHRLNCVMLCG